MGNSYSMEADIFSFGIIVAEMVGVRNPKERKEDDHFAFNLSEFQKKADLDTPLDFVEVVRICTYQDATKRPTFSQLADGLQGLTRREFVSEGIEYVI